MRCFGIAAHVGDSIPRGLVYGYWLCTVLGLIIYFLKENLIIILNGVEFISIGLVSFNFLLKSGSELS